MKEIKENRLNILQAIEELREEKKRSPYPKEIIGKLNISGSVVGGLIRRMRREGLLERRMKGQDSKVYITLAGYRYLEMGNGKLFIKRGENTAEPVENTIKEVRGLDNKDRYILLLEWLYDLEDDDILENGWRKKIANKVKELFAI